MTRMRQEAQAALTLIDNIDNHVGVDTPKAHPILNPTKLNKFIERYFWTKSPTKSPIPDFQIDFCKRIMDSEDTTEFLIWHRESGKTWVSVELMPLWLCLTGKIKLALIVGRNLDNAIRTLALIKRHFENKQILDDFNEGNPMIRRGDDTKSEFIVGDCKFIARGLDQPIRGIRHGNHRLHYTVLDDIESTNYPKSIPLIQEQVDRVKGEILGAYGVGQVKYLIISNNLFRRAGIVDGLLQDFKGVDNANISVINLLNKNGGYSWKGRFPKDWADKKKREVGSLTFAREYMNNPVISGNLFEAQHKQFTDRSPTHKTSIVGFWDLAYSDKGDTTALSLVWKEGLDYIIDKVVCRHISIENWLATHLKIAEDYFRNDMRVHWFYDASVDQKHILKPYLSPELDKLGKIRGLLHPVHMKGSKFDRITTSLLKLWEDRRIFFNKKLELSNDFLDYMDQILSFEKGTKFHDDAPDSLSGAFDELNKMNPEDAPDDYTGLIEIEDPW